MRDRPSVRQQVVGMLFAGPYIVGFCAFLLLPMGMTVYYSLCNYNMLRAPLWSGLSNYRGLMSDPYFLVSLKNTMIYAVASVPLTLAASLGLAMLLNRPWKGQAVYRTIVFLPSLVPAVAAAVIWLTLFNAKLGLINAVLSAPIRAINAVAPGAHLSAPLWLDSETWAMPALILMSVWGIGNTVVIFLAGLQDIPQELYEAAELDGARGLSRLLNVTVPMLSPVIFFNLIMGVIGSWQVFTVPFIMTGGGPNNATLFYTMRLFNVAFTELRIGYASAMSLIQFGIIMALTAVLFWTSRKWVHYR